MRASRSSTAGDYSSKPGHGLAATASRRALSRHGSILGHGSINVIALLSLLGPPRCPSPVDKAGASDLFAK